VRRGECSRQIKSADTAAAGSAKCTSPAACCPRTSQATAAANTTNAPSMSTVYQVTGAEPATPRSVSCSSKTAHSSTAAMKYSPTTLIVHAIPAATPATNIHRRCRVSKYRSTAAIPAVAKNSVYHEVIPRG